MQRSKALVAATIIAVTLFTGAVAYAASSGVLDGRNDNVGKLQPIATQPIDVTPTTAPRAANSAVVTPAPQAVTPSPNHTPGADDPASHDVGDDHGGDRPHGRDGDDD
jgi:hypothetical protein